MTMETELRNTKKKPLSVFSVMHMPVFHILLRNFDAILLF